MHQLVIHEEVSIMGCLAALFARLAATTAAQHTAFATAAEVFIAENNITGAVSILTPVGILILSLVMLKGVFPKGVAYLGIVSEALRPILGPGYFVYGLLLPIWFLAVGWKLYRLGSSSSHSRMAKKLEARAAS